MSTLLDQLELPTLDLPEETVTLARRERRSEASDFRFFGPYWTQIMRCSMPLLLGDFVALGASLGCAYGLTSWLPAEAQIDFGRHLLLMGLTMPVTFALFGLYPGTALKAMAEAGQIAFATTLLFALLLIVASSSGASAATRLPFLVAAISLLALVPLFRSITRRFASSFRWWGQPTLIFGGGDAARNLYNYYTSHPRLGVRPVAIIDDWSVRSPEFGATEASLFSERVESLRREHHVYWAILSTPMTVNSAATVRSYLAVFPYVLIVPDGDGLPKVHRQMFDCGNLPCVPMTNNLLLPLPRLLKKSMDVVLISILGLLCLPLFATIALVIKLTSPGPVFYAQERVGKGSRPFRAWKFRTMVANAEEVLQQTLENDPALRAEWELDHKLKNDPRVSSVGVWLRKTSLDELPQLWNVFCGEMSLVGPRPIVKAEIVKYGDWFELYKRATPGITGMWQISGRNNTTYEVRVAHDRDYVLNWSPWLDLYILARTVKVVLRSEGAY